MACASSIAVTLNVTSLVSSGAQWQHALDHVNTSQKSDERYTPKWVLDLVEQILGVIDLDPCADPQKRVPALRHLTKEDDGLSCGWSGKVFLNPPFSKSSDWIKHLSIYCHTGSVSEAVVLVPVMSLNNKSSSLLMKGTASAFAMIGRQLSFLDQDYKEMGVGTMFPFTLVYVGNRTQHFLDQVRDVGIGCLLEQQPQNQTTAFCAYCGSAFTAKRSNARFCSTSCRVQSHRKGK